MEAGVGVGGEMLHAHANLAGPLGYFVRLSWLVRCVSLPSGSLGGFLLTGPDQLGDVSVAGDLAVGDLLDGAVHGVEEGFGFVGSRHAAVVWLGCYLEVDARGGRFIVL